MPSAKKSRFLTLISAAIGEVVKGVSIQDADKDSSATDTIVCFDTWLTPETVSDYDPKDFPSDDQAELTILVEKFRAIAEQAPVDFSPVAKGPRDEAVQILSDIYRIVETDAQSKSF